VRLHLLAHVVVLVAEGQAGNPLQGNLPAVSHNLAPVRAAICKLISFL
jgi:hypothetical protein